MTWIKTSASQLGTERMPVNSWGPWEREWQYSAHVYVGREKLQSEKQSFAHLCCREIWMLICTLCEAPAALFKVWIETVWVFVSRLFLCIQSAPFLPPRMTCVSKCHFCARYTRDVCWALIACCMPTHKYMHAKFGIYQPQANIFLMWYILIAIVTAHSAWGPG